MHDDRSDVLTESRPPTGAPATARIDRAESRYTRVDEGGTPVYVAFSPKGISFVLTAESVGGDPVGFVDAHRRRFGGSLAPSAVAPAGLARALRSGHSAGLTFDLDGLTPFQREVLGVTAGIPRGETRPYAWVAREIGRPGAVRAVGTALGHNPVPILVPCHRVTRSDGSTGNYGFGRDLKEALLRAEEVNLDEVAEMARRGAFYRAGAGTGVFCLPTCHDARRVPAADRRDFATTTAAAAAGFRSCPRCRPAPDPTGG